MAAALCAAAVMLATAQPAPSFDGFVERFLQEFASHHPSIAAGNGLHQFDDRLEDFSAAAIQKEIAMWRGLKGDLAAIPAGGLTPDQQVDHRIVSGLLDAWLLDLDTNRNWQKNLMLYASAVSDGVHNLMTMESAPVEVRARRVIAKLGGVPALLAAARANITNPPRVMAERGVRMLKGASGMLGPDLSLAFADMKDARLKADLASAGATAREIDRGLRAWFEKEKLPSANGTYVVGRANLEARYRAEELIDLPAAQLLAIGERELARNETAFAEAAARVDKAKPALAVWSAVLNDHPKRGEVVAAGQKAVDELQAFVVAKQLVNLPPSEKVNVAAAREFDLGLASMHASPPLEATPVKSYYYITDAQASWPAAQQDAWLQKFNYSTLAVITSHEVMPGHYVHSVFMRKTPGKIRRIWIGLNPFPQPSSGQDGWAHYAEQLMVDQGFRAGDPRYQMAQVSEALTRICRLDLRHSTAHRRVDGRSGGGVLRAEGAPAGAGGAAGGRARHLRSDLRRIFSRQDGRVQAAAGPPGIAWREIQLARVSRTRDDQRHRAVVGASAVDVAGRQGAGAAVSNPHTLIDRQVETARAGKLARVVARMPSGWAVLGDPQILPGYCLLLPDPVVPHLNVLTGDARRQFLDDMTRLGDAVLAMTGAERINYEILGNLEPALHAHVIPRFATEDPEDRKRAVWLHDWTKAPAFDPALHGELIYRISEHIRLIR